MASVGLEPTSSVWTRASVSRASARSSVWARASVSRASARSSVWARINTRVEPTDER